MFDHLNEPDEWQAFERDLREAFDQRDGLHFEVLLMRMQNLVVYSPDVDHTGRLTQ